MDLKKFDFKHSDISTFLVRTGIVIESKSIKPKEIKSKFSLIDKRKLKKRKSEISIGLSDDSGEEEKKEIKYKKLTRSTVLNTEEEGMLYKYDDTR